METIVETENEHMSSRESHNSAMQLRKKRTSIMTLQHLGDGLAGDEDIFYEAEESIKAREKMPKSKRFSSVSVASSIAVLAPFFTGYEESSKGVLQLPKRSISFNGFAETLKAITLPPSSSPSEVSLRINPERISMFMQKAADNVEKLQDDSLASKTVNDWSSSLEVSFEEEGKSTEVGLEVPHIPDVEEIIEAPLPKSPSGHDFRPLSMWSKRSPNPSVDPASSVDDASVADSSLPADQPISASFGKKKSSKRTKIRSFFRSIFSPFHIFH